MSKIYYRCSWGDAVRQWDALGSWGLYAILDKGDGVWDFKGKVGSLQVDEREWTCGKQILAEPLRSNGIQSSSTNRLC